MSDVAQGMGFDEAQLPPANDHYERTSLVFESILAGHLVHWQPMWSPNVRLVTDPAAPWFPTVFGWLGASTSTRVTRETSQLTADKVRTQQLLEAAGVPTPRSVACEARGFEDARRFAAEIGWPVVVKPRCGGQGRGVSGGITSGAELRRAFAHLEAAGYGTQPFLIQRHVEGRCYRVLASRDRIYGANYYLPASVIGDGRSSIAELVAAKNRLRKSNPHLGADRYEIPLDEDASQLFAEQGLLPSSIPGVGEEVGLSVVANPHMGAETVAVTQELHPSVEALATRVVRAIPGLDYGGLDIILTRGHAEASSTEGCAVLEVNSGTALGGHLYPMYGRPENVCRELVRDTAAAARLAPWRFDHASVVAIVVRLMHDSRSGVPATGLPDLGPVAIPKVIARDRDTLAVLTGKSSSIYEALHDHLARVFGTIIAVRVEPDFTGHDGPTLEQRLPPAPFLPLRHAETLVAANRCAPRLSGGPLSSRGSPLT